MKLALCVFPFCTFQGFQKHKDEFWGPMGSAPSRMVNFWQKWGKNTKEMTIISELFLFWTDANFSIPLSLLIYIFPILCVYIRINNTQGHNVSGHNGQYGQNGHNGKMYISGESGIEKFASVQKLWPKLIRLWNYGHFLDNSFNKWFYDCPTYLLH